MLACRKEIAKFAKIVPHKKLRPQKVVALTELSLKQYYEVTIRWWEHANNLFTNPSDVRFSGLRLNKLPLILLVVAAARSSLFALSHEGGHLDARLNKDVNQSSSNTGVTLPVVEAGQKIDKYLLEWFWLISH